MMEISKHEDMEACERQVRLWLKKWRIQYEHYVNLPAFRKIVLHKLICMPTQSTTYTERRDLYRSLCLSGGRESIDPVDSKTDEQLRTFFSPLTSGERLHDLEKY